MRIAHVMFAGWVVVAIPSCALFSPGSGAAVPASLEERSNGYVLNIPSTGSATDISAFVTGEHWVVVTIADPAFPEMSIGDVPTAVIDSFEVTRFPTATQLALHFREVLRGVEAVRSQDDEYLQIAVFLQNPKRRREN